ncbi:unnamed protein product, partial [Polarella glacialis]
LETGAMLKWTGLSSWLVGGADEDAAAAETKQEEERCEEKAKDAAIPVHSRSTSPGSTRSPGGLSSLESASNSAAPSPVKGKVPGLPDIEYPSSINIQNTFFNMSMGRPMSLDGFYEERGSRSCPTSAIGAPPGLNIDEEKAAKEQEVGADPTPPNSNIYESGEEKSPHLSPAFVPVYWPRTLSGDELEDLLSHAQMPMMPTPVQMPPLVKDAGFLRGPPPPPAQRAPDFGPDQPLPPPPPGQDGVDRVPLRLSQALGPVPELGSAEMPTEGSRNHRFGTCRPCAFQHTKGCGNGLMCEFCHICEPGEKKRRAKARQEIKREVKMLEPYMAGMPPQMAHMPLSAPSYLAGWGFGR